MKGYAMFIRHLPYDRPPEFHDGAAVAFQLVATEVADYARWMHEYDGMPFERHEVIYAQRDSAELYKAARDARDWARTKREAIAEGQRDARDWARTKREAIAEGQRLVASEPF